jgi:hypothetical protein
LEQYFQCYSIPAQTGMFPAEILLRNLIEKHGISETADFRCESNAPTPEAIRSELRSGQLFCRKLAKTETKHLRPMFRKVGTMAKLIVVPTPNDEILMEFTVPRVIVNYMAWDDEDTYHHMLPCQVYSILHS